MLREILENLSDIKPKWNPPKGTFDKDADPKKSAEIICKGHNSDLKKSIESVNFFFNRCGSKCKDWSLKNELIKELHKLCK